MPVVGLFDLVRISSLENIFNPNRSFANSWNNNLKSEILNLLDLTDQKTSRQSILDLGAQMRDIFQTGGTNSRGQGSAAVSNSLASTAGYGWERFATWYLNVLSAGTNCVAMIQSSQTKLLPDSFRDAFAVTINNHQVSSDLDVVLVHWIGDDSPFFQKTYDSSSRTDVLEGIRDFKNLVSKEPENFSICVLSTKTNWNDAIQTPMLWNLVFTHGFRHPLVSVGRRQCHPSMFGFFSYGFFTLPSGSAHTNFTRTTMAVVRASTMTAGSYWGKAENLAVGMRPLNEIFSTRTHLPLGPQIGGEFYNYIQDPAWESHFGLD